MYNLTDNSYFNSEVGASLSFISIDLSLISMGWWYLCLWLLYHATLLKDFWTVIVLCWFRSMVWNKLFVDSLCNTCPIECYDLRNHLMHLYENNHNEMIKYALLPCSCFAVISTLNKLTIRSCFALIFLDMVLVFVICLCRGIWSYGLACITGCGTYRGGEFSAFHLLQEIDLQYEGVTTYPVLNWEWWLSDSIAMLLRLRCSKFVQKPSTQLTRISFLPPPLLGVGYCTIKCNAPIPDWVKSCVKNLWPRFD